jgi:hypothetical protein
MKGDAYISQSENLWLIRTIEDIPGRDSFAKLLEEFKNYIPW